VAGVDGRLARIATRALVIAALLAVVAIVGLVGIARGWFGRTEVAGEVTPLPVPREIVAEKESRRSAAAGRLGSESPKRVLFGDLHVHTTFSADAFLFSLPLLQGEGAHPPADACDFARHCSGLDFWSINDHAEALTPRTWAETIESVRQCNAVAGDATSPDLVTYLGWEWTQVGTTPEDHYGHKNVVLRETRSDRIPSRPIASPRGLGSPLLFSLGLPLVARDRRSLDMTTYLAELAAREPCAEGVGVRELPPDCHEVARTPDELFSKLADWGHASIVIPHGTAWGWTMTRVASWDLQLGSGRFENDRQSLIEVYSGHGNSEEYREFRNLTYDADGEPLCPKPSERYTPPCWRAGQIIRARCDAEGESENECAARAEEARRLFLAADKSGVRTVPGAAAEDWLDAGQCIDCFQPAFDYQPAFSVQAALARRRFDGPSGPRGFRFGLIASSDVHTARPGTGYKEFARHDMTDVSGPAGPVAGFAPARGEAAPRSVAVEPTPGFQGRDTERVASFLYTGGLIGVHASGRDRGAIWDALRRREVYGTSGPRILLWFDLLNGPGAELPMGSEVAMQAAPEFRVRAAGSLEQRPGCPEHAVSALAPQRLARLCRGECYNPTDRRRRIARIEVVRILPQIRPDEPLRDLIADPWRSFACDGGPAGCEVRFRDDAFPSLGREALYYVRAVEEPSPAINAGNLRCERDEKGDCLRPRPCYADSRTGPADDCLSETEQRAWSSPIFVDFAPGG
jgi:hypothetical protein